jgi:hypothetical protein
MSSILAKQLDDAMKRSDLLADHPRTIARLIREEVTKPPGEKNKIVIEALLSSNERIGREWNEALREVTVLFDQIEAARIVTGAQS